MKPYIPTIATTTLVAATEHNSAFLIPILFRIGMMIGVPVFHFYYHRFSHHLIHLGHHRFDWLASLSNRFKWLPDAIMILSLIILHFVMEAHVGGEGAA